MTFLTDVQSRTKREIKYQVQTNDVDIEKKLLRVQSIKEEEKKKCVLKKRYKNRGKE